MKRKLRSRRGMTLTELLVALVIVSLIGVSLTVGVNGAATVYRDSTQLYEAETLCGTILTCLEDEFRFGHNIRVSGGEVLFDSQIFGADAAVTLSEGKVFMGKTPTSANKLLGDAAYTSGLTVSTCTIKYTDGQVEITVGVSSKKAKVEHTVKVAPVDP